MGQINWKDKCWVTTIYLVRDDGKVLLTMNKNLRQWIPMGGHIDPGDTPDEAIRREVAEESGFEFEFFPEPSEYGNVFRLRPQHIQLERVPHHNVHMNIVWFGRCTRYDESRTATDEGEEIRWFSEDEIEGMKDSMFESVYTESLQAIRAITGRA